MSKVRKSIDLPEAIMNKIKLQAVIENTNPKELIEKLICEMFKNKLSPNELKK